MIFALAPENDKQVIAYCDDTGISYPHVWCKSPGQVVAELRVREQGPVDSVILVVPKKSTPEATALVWALKDAKATLHLIGPAPENKYADSLREAYEALIKESSNWVSLAKARAKEGGAVNGRPPYGYRLEDGTLRPHPRQAPIIKEVFRQHDAGISNSMVAKSIAKTWPKSGSWDGCRVARICKRRELYRTGVYKTTSGIITNPALVISPQPQAQE